MTSPLDDLIAAEREAPPQAPALQSKRTWKRLQKSLAVGAAAPFDLPPSSVGAGATSAVHATATGTATATGVKAAVLGTTAKVFLATVIGGTATLTTIAALTSDPAPAPAPASTSAAVVSASPSTTRAPEAPVPEPTPPVEAVAQPTEPTETTQPTEPTATTQPTEPTATTQPTEPTAPERTPKSKRSTQPATAKAATAKPTPAKTNTLTEELEVIRQASRAVNAGRYGEALGVLREHAKHFADGALLEDRLALRAIALCGAGKLESGTKAATRFSKTYPRSVHATRVREACEHDEEL